MELPFLAPAPTQSTRVFCGYRLPTLTRENFFTELSRTFMPGTPYTLAPLGLSAYVAAVLDLDPALGLPDEAALIVYASNESYVAGREHSLAGRMYTHSHAGVFDMQRSRGQFPGKVDQPTTLEALGRVAWALFDRPVDWQYGVTRLIFLHGPVGGGLHTAMQASTKAGVDALRAAGADQAIVVATSDYAALWIHSEKPLPADVSALRLWPAELSPARDLTAGVVPMPTMIEGPTVVGAAAYTFRFMRNPRYFL